MQRPGVMAVRAPLIATLGPPSRTAWHWQTKVIFDEILKNLGKLGGGPIKINRRIYRFFSKIFSKKIEKRVKKDF